MEHIYFFTVIIVQTYSSVLTWIWLKSNLKKGFYEILIKAITYVFYLILYLAYGRIEMKQLNPRRILQVHAKGMFAHFITAKCWT